VTGEEALRLRGSDAAGECVLTFADLLRGWAAVDDFFCWAFLVVNLPLTMATQLAVVAE